MTVDLEGTLPEPVRLRDMLREATTVHAALTGGPTVRLTAVVGRTYERGELVSAGVVAPPDLQVGDFEHGMNVTDPKGTQFVDFGIEGLGDQARLLVMDHRTSATDPHDRSFCVSPFRTPVGVVTALSVSLALARLGRGEFIDMNIRFIEPPVSDPDEFVERTRSVASYGSVEEACLHWVRQFEHLNGWPPG